MLRCLVFGMQKSFDKQIHINYMCMQALKAGKKQERSFLEQISARTKRNSGGGKKLFSVNVFECAVINRAQFKGSGNVRRFLSRLTSFLQHAVGAGKRALLHIRMAGCLKK